MEHTLRIAELVLVQWGLANTGLLFLRLLPIVLFTPIFGGGLVPRRHRLAVAMVLSVAILPPFLGPRVAFDPVVYALDALGQILVGVTVALVIRFTFEMAAASGALVDTARGAMNASLFDPSTQDQKSVLATFVLQLLVVVFFVSGAHELLLRGIADGLEEVPLRGPLPARFEGRAAIEALLFTVAGLITLALRLAAPALAVLFLVDLALGMVNKMAAQIPVYFVGLTVKATLGTAVLFLVLAVSFDELLREALSNLLGWIR